MNTTENTVLNTNTKESYNASKELLQLEYNKIINSLEKYCKAYIGK